MMALHNARWPSQTMNSNPVSIYRKNVLVSIKKKKIEIYLVLLKLLK